jgi:flagellar basal body-associated protein FliL
LAENHHYIINETNADHPRLNKKRRKSMKKTLTKLVAMLMVAAMAFSFVGFMPREANARAAANLPPNPMRSFRSS